MNRNINKAALLFLLNIEYTFKRTITNTLYVLLNAVEDYNQCIGNRYIPASIINEMLEDYSDEDLSIINMEFDNISASDLLENTMYLNDVRNFNHNIEPKGLPHTLKCIGELYKLN